MFTKAKRPPYEHSQNKFYFFERELSKSQKLAVHKYTSKKLPGAQNHMTNYAALIISWHKAGHNI